MYKLWVRNMRQNTRNLWGCSREDQAFSPSYDWILPMMFFFKYTNNLSGRVRNVLLDNGQIQSVLKIEDLRYRFFTSLYPFFKKKRKNVVEALKTKFLWLELSIFKSRLPHLKKKDKKYCRSLQLKLQENHVFVTGITGTHIYRMGNGCSGGEVTPDPSPKRRRYDLLR